MPILTDDLNLQEIEQSEKNNNSNNKTPQTVTTVTSQVVKVVGMIAREAGSISVLQHCLFERRKTDGTFL